MTVKLDMSGMDDFKKRLRTLAEGQTVPVTELLSDKFLKEHTPFKTLDELLNAAGAFWMKQQLLGGDH